MTTDPTIVPSTNQQNPDIPPLPYIHFHVNDNTRSVHARIYMENKVIWMELPGIKLPYKVSRYAQKHGLLGNWKTLAGWAVKPK